MNVNKFFCLIAITSSFLMLTGCGGGGSRYAMKKDAPPPSRNINFARIPNAVPKPLPKSRYGNKSPYVVLGKRYRVMPSANGYHQKGLISWYGAKFHGHLTSTRERYNLYGMTAASKWLPLPTYVEVTNLKNGRHVILKVNDRGPFVKTRIMDVSYAAAKKLNFIRSGTTMADVRAINPYSYARYQKEKNRKMMLAYYNKKKIKAAATSRPIPVKPSSAPAVVTGTTLAAASNVALVTNTGNETTPTKTQNKNSTLTNAPSKKESATEASIASSDSKEAATTNDLKPKKAVTLASNETKAQTKSEATTKESPKAKAEDLYLQVGAFSSLDNAKDLSDKITALTNVPTNINPVKAHDKSIYRVEIGPLANSAEKERVAKILAKKGMEHPIHAG